MLKIKTIIIDDEFLARKRIKNQLNKSNKFVIISECPSGEIAIEKIKNLKPDLIFLDIELKDMNGFQVLNELVGFEDLIVVFVTAHENFAINAFNSFAFDYILKPFENNRFKKTLKKIVEHFKFKNEFLLNAKKNFNNFKKLPYTVGHKIKFIDFFNIKYILASGSYCEVYIKNDKKIPLRNSLNNIIYSLNQGKFIRIHRSTIINIDYLDEIMCSSYQETDVRMLDRKIFRVSKSYRNDVLECLKIH